MNLDVTLFSLAAEPIITQVWSMLTRKIKVHHMEEYTQALTKLVTERRESRTLFVSIGTGDFLAPWLTRLYTEESIAFRDREPKISKLVVKRLPSAMISELEKIHLLEDGFNTRVEMNIQALKKDPNLKRSGVSVEEREWKDIPPFHGYMYGEKILIGPWMVNEAGQLHVKAPLWETRQKDFPKRHETVRTWFEAS